MIDWLTIKCKIGPELIDQWWRYVERNDCWIKVEEGEFTLMRHDWKSIRSDQRGFSVKVSTDGFLVAGSPCYALGKNENVFGSSDYKECRDALINGALDFFRSKAFPMDRWHLKCEEVSRADITFNFLMDNEEQVKSILNGLDHIETGRFRTSRKYSSTVYLGGKSRTIKSKAYAKGIHLLHEMSKGKQIKISASDLILAQRLLRFECQFGRDYFRRAIGPITSEKLEDDATNYLVKLFGEIGDVEMASSEQKRIEEVAVKPGLSRNVLRTLQLIRAQGSFNVKMGMADATYYKHITILRQAGFGEAELSGKGARLFTFPVREILATRVDSWEQLRLIA